MKQVLIRKGNAMVGETPLPPVGAGNVLVKVYCSLVSTGTELAGIQRSGASLLRRVIANPANIRKAINLVKKQGLGRTAETVKRQTTSEVATGYSCSGRIIEIGEGISDLHVGDPVACAGAGKAYHAEYVSVPRNLAVKVPENCSMDDAASVTLGAIAMQGMRRARVSLGETVAVIGLGLIGQITVQLLRAAGCIVAGIDIDEARVRLAQSLGMKFGVNPLVEDPAVFVRNITCGLGVDAAIITADSKEDAIVQQAMEITRKKGKVVIVGSVGLGLQRKPFYEKEIDLLISCSYGPGRYDASYEEQGIDYPPAYVRWTENRNMESYLRLIGDGKIDFQNLVQARYSVDKAAEAFEALKNHENRPLAVILEYGKDALVTEVPGRVLRVSATSKTGVIRLGIIGCGAFATAMHLPNLKALTNLYAIHALSGRDGARLGALGREYDVAYVTTDYRRILEDADVDMVLVSTRHNLHAGISVEALHNGKAVFVEKPLATTSDDLAQVRDLLLSDTGDPKLQVGFNRRFSPAAKRMKDLLSGRTNPAIVVYTVNAGYVPPDHWVHTEEGGGRIIGEACHMLDLFRYLIGRPPASVDVSAVNPATAHVGSRDNVVCTISFEDGSLCTLVYTALGSKEREKETVDVFCDNKIFRIRDYRSLEVYGSREKGWSGKLVDKGHRAELESFARFCKGETGPPIPYEEILNTTELSFTIDRIARGLVTDAG